MVGCEICGMEHTTKHHVDGLEKSEIFLAIITRHYVREPWHVKEAELVSALKKPMIAYVEKGVDWGEYRRFPWAKVIEFDRDHFDIKEIGKELVSVLKELGGRTCR